MSKEKQIEEMVKELCVDYGTKCCGCGCKPCAVIEHCKVLYNAGYRKQSEGEWVVTNKNGFWYYDCPFCDDGYAQETKLPVSNYCANCGAKLSEPKMKGGAE